MTRDDTAVRTLLNQQPLLLLLLLRMNQGPQRLLKTAGLSCPSPPPLRRALDHQSNLLHECTQSATHQRATADLGQTAGIRWDYRPRCPLLFGCPPPPSSHSPPQKSPPSPWPHPPYQSCSGTATDSSMASRKQEKQPLLSSPLSVQHANTLSDKWNQTQTHTVDL